MTVHVLELATLEPIIFQTFGTLIFLKSIYELFSRFSEVKMSIRIDVSISFIGLLQVVIKIFQYGGSFFRLKLKINFFLTT